MSTTTNAQPKTKAPVTRTVVICLVLILTLAAVAIAIPWANYRYKNIVLREASVRGAVTKLGARIDGRIKSIDVVPGQNVTKGQILLRMEDSHLRAALERARGDLKSAKLELENEKLSIAQARRRLTFEIDRSKLAIKKATSGVAAHAAGATPTRLAPSSSVHSHGVRNGRSYTGLRLAFNVITGSSWIQQTLEPERHCGNVCWCSAANFLAGH